jgi:hypothetical protein
MGGNEPPGGPPGPRPRQPSQDPDTPDGEPPNPLQAMMAGRPPDGPQPSQPQGGAAADDEQSVTAAGAVKDTRRWLFVTDAHGGTEVRDDCGTPIVSSPPTSSEAEATLLSPSPAEIADKKIAARFANWLRGKMPSLSASAKRTLVLGVRDNPSSRWHPDYKDDFAYAYPRLGGRGNATRVKGLFQDRAGNPLVQFGMSMTRRTSTRTKVCIGFRVYLQGKRTTFSLMCGILITKPTSSILALISAALPT